MTQPYGATAKVWRAYEAHGWGASMLPVVSDPSKKIDENSKMKQLGKTPSVLTPSGTVVGLSKWTTLTPTQKQRELWASQNYGICIRCGTVVAFDCDVNDAALAQELFSLFSVMFGAAPVRRRAGSSRWLAVLRIDIPVSKSRAVFPTGDAFEVLGLGQQFVAEGTHPSGSRYTWSPELGELDAVPETTPDAVNGFLAYLSEKYNAEVAQGRMTAPRVVGETIYEPDPIADFLRATGRVIDEKDGVLHIRCPWEHEHSTESSVSATSYFSRGALGKSEPGFKCMHAHCANKTYDDLLVWAHSEGFVAPTASDFPQLPALEEDEAEIARLKAIIEGARDPKTLIVKACLPTVMAALRMKDYCRVELAYDTFTGGVVYRDVAEAGKPLRGDGGSYVEWRVFGDAEGVLMRARLEHEFQFAPVGRELMRDAINGLALGGICTVDTMQDYLNMHLPAWDGVPRVETFFEKYCGAEPSLFSSELGRYLFAALYGRAWSSGGVKADITPILVGRQGTFKSTLISALALKPDTFGELDFSKKDDDLKRLIRGRCVIELPEMNGFSKRDADSIKFFLSLKEDSWIPKYMENFVTSPRRCVFLASTNNTEVLSDPTGSRRFAPIETGEIRIDEVRVLVPQLWAEGKAIFEKEGIPHRKLESLAAARASRFEASDPWAEAIADWLSEQESLPENERTPITPKSVMLLALGLPVSRVKPSDTRRVGALLRSLGLSPRYDKGKDGRTVRVWKR